MAMSMFQKVTLATCLVLCVALLMPKILLSRGRKDGADRPDGGGNFPPKVNRQAAPEGRGQKSASSFSRAQNTEANARAKGAGTGAGTGGKSNLAGQIIPVYGFGILLYILYILFKITSKGNNNNNKQAFREPVPFTDFELSQLQDKLRETEMVMENIVSYANHSSDRWGGGCGGPGGESPAAADGDHSDYPEEPQQQWEHPSHCSCQQHQTEEEAERTQADGADVENLPEDVTNEAEVPNAERESDPAAVRGEEAELQREEVPEHKQGAGGIDLGVPEEELGGVLEELELTLKVTTLMEQEKMDDLSRDHGDGDFLQLRQAQEQEEESQESLTLTPTSLKLFCAPTLFT
ncbi:hypothetical protein F7725_023263 [Dissostichus mawsoni]|uniref:Resistance to inhibitors of cholinesterase protein 3 N-terminal domain-containing protein n=1 Tax=Dissostichus mawsoni TaxID=36200 RepID=A0A7J5Z4G6_DISMA|nr:hypothetical protein F7725_023263 [Dissostichus mawsoni]